MWMDTFAQALSRVADNAINMAEIAALLRPMASGYSHHRSSGTRARRQWKRRRAAGITKQVRS